MGLIYNCLLVVLSPFVVLFTALQARRRGGDRRFVKQRLGWPFDRPSDKARVWFHAASVGELMAIVPLLAAYANKESLLLTTNTPESARLAAKLLPTIRHRYCPVDFPWAVASLIADSGIQKLIVVETELWPNLFGACHQHGVRIAIINGRVSEKTVSANRFVRRLYRRLLADVEVVWARSAEDAERFSALGLAAHKLQVLGNIKFAVRPSTVLCPPLPGRDYVLAVSTHDDEEVQLADLWQRLEQPPLLVIIPRHPPRGAQIAHALRERGYDVALRSANEVVDDSTAFYIADTLGEVAAFACSALWCFIGGSLVPVGGHNMLELAAEGQAIISGPYLDNFKEEASFLQQRQALRVADDIDELSACVTLLMQDKHIREEQGARARLAMAEAADVLDSYIEVVDHFISTTV